MGKKRGGNKQHQQQHQPVEAAAPRTEEIAVVEETTPSENVVEAAPITKQPADLPEDSTTTTATEEPQQQQEETTTPRGNTADEELTPGGESPQGKKQVVNSAPVATEEKKKEEEEAPAASTEATPATAEEEKEEEGQQEATTAAAALESPASTVEEKPLVPSYTDESTAHTTPAAEGDNAATSNSSSPCTRNELINERIDQFFALPVVEFVGLIIIKLAVAVLAFVLRLKSKVLQSELFAKVQQTAIVASALNLVDTKKVQQASVEGLDLLDSKVIVPLQLMDETTPQGKLFKGASVVVFDILADAQKQVDNSIKKNKEE